VAAVGLLSLVWWKERDHLAARAEGAGAGFVDMIVPAGARPRTFPLADGSRVTLAPGSTLRSRGTFGDSSRTLELTGEALFNVAAGRVPFRVAAAGITVEDISTAFAVRAIAAAPGAVPRALVAVTQGAVRVLTPRWQGEVREGRALLVDSSGTHQALGAADARGSVAWTSGALLFADELVATALERLERWTGLRIEVDSSLHQHRLSVAMEAESPEETVTHLAAVLGARAIARDGHWAIVPR
jgi:ferric-dicitrate binding protein FerR (iron transport regulator)